MGLANTVRAGVALADKITKDLQVVILHEAWVSQDQYGAPTFDPAVGRKAILTKKYGHTYTKDGQEINQRYSILFVGPITENGAENRSEPIDPRDRLTLPDGTSGTILDVGEIADSKTGRPYIYEVAIG